eukprot:COSAG05_NODE_6157_length_1011_cov_3.641441_2_plen_155_part_00
MIDGRKRFSITCPGHAISQLSLKDDTTTASCEVQLASVQLAEYPSIAGQAVYVAVQLRLAPANHSGGVGLTSTASPVVASQLKLYDGQAWLYPADSAIPKMLRPDNEWQLLTLCAVSLPWQGQARFVLEISSIGAVVELGRVVVAQVGTPWERA